MGWVSFKPVRRMYQDIASRLHAATGKTTPADADELGLIDSEASNALKKLTWANLKATLKTYFDTLYGIVGGALGSTDNAVPRANGTGGKTLQSSGVTIDDNNDMAGVRNLTATGSVSAASAVIGGKEISSQSGESTFAGQTGQTVAITEVVSADYHVDITPLAESGFIGEIWISTRTVNSFVVKNSGSDVSSAFAWRISGAALA